MDKQEYISYKIKKLMAEGKSHDQAVAIAISMEKERHKKQEGGIEKALYNYMQQGGWYDNNPTFFQTNQPAYPSPTTAVLNPYIPGDNNGDGIVDAKDQVDKFGNPVQTEQAVMPYSYQPQAQPWNDYNFDGGISNPAALQYSLYNFGQGNTTQGVLGAAKAGLGFLREGLSAYAAGKANKYAVDQYNEKQYDNWRNFKYGQQGGDIQSDIDFNRNWYENRTQILDTQGNTVPLPKFNLMYNPSISFTDYGNTSTAGEYNPETKNITLATDYNQRGVSGIPAHEVNHYLQNQLPSGAYIDYIYNPVINSMGLQNEELYQTGTPEQRYLREPEEVHSRLMQFRQLNNYQPNQIITPEILQQSQGKEQFKLDMFDDTQLTNLLNQTVSADQDTSIYFAQQGGATRQDSLNVYNNSRIVEKYYRDLNYNRTPPSNIPTTFDVHRDNQDAYNEFVSNYKNNQPLYVEKTGKTKTLSPSNPEFEKVPISDYKKKIDNNRYLQREIYNNYISKDAPMQLFDKRISPVMMKDYSKGNDQVKIYSYNNIANKPFDLLTEAEKKERIEKYGTNGVPKSYLNSTIPITDIKETPYLEPLDPLNSTGLIKFSDTPVDSDTNIPNQYIQPKYWNVQDNVNQNFGATQTNYRVTPQTADYMLNTIAPQPYNTRITIPYYQEGGDVNPSPENIIQAYAQISGQNPQDIVAQLQQLPPDQQQQALQQMIQAIQQAQSQQQVMQEGGETQDTGITGAEALTGEYAVAVPEGAKSTVEVEGGEWVKDNKTGEVQQVVGKKHAQGGVDLNLEDAKIVSDYTKIGAENAKHFSKTYDIKVKASDTFATVLDKVNTKSGLAKLIDEETSISEQMEKVLTKPDADPSSQEINAQFLTDKMQEVKTKQDPLKAYRSAVFDDVFKRQEAQPKKGDGSQILDKSGNPIKAQEGLEVNPFVIELAQQYNIDPERVQEILIENQTYYQQGGKIKAQQGTQVYSDKDRQERFKIWAENMKAYGYKGATNVSAKNLDEEAGKLQEWVIDNKPELVLEYFQTQPMTAKGVDIIKAKYPEAFSQANIAANKQSAQYTPEEKEALKGALGNKLDSSFWLDQFKDKKYDWRGILTTGVPELPAISGTFNDIKAVALPNFYQPEQQQPTVQEVAEQVKEKVPRTPAGNINLPFESLYLPPSAIQPVFLAQVQAPKVDFIKATAEPNLVEIERQRINTQDQLGFLPSSQRATMIANTLAQGQSATNQAISQVEIANQQAENTARAQQANLDFKADLANQQYRQDYEAKVFAGMNAYEQALQNYYNQAYNIPGMLNELNRNKRLAYNQLNENYKIGTSGVQFADNGQPILYAPNNNANANYVDINQLSPTMQKQIEKAMKPKKS